MYYTQYYSPHLTVSKSPGGQPLMVGGGGGRQGATLCAAAPLSCLILFGGRGQAPPPPVPAAQGGDYRKYQANPTWGRYNTHKVTETLIDGMWPWRPWLPLRFPLVSAVCVCTTFVSGLHLKRLTHAKSYLSRLAVGSITYFPQTTFATFWKTL